MTITDDLIQTTFATPDPQGARVLDLSLLDWAACGIAGRDEPVSQILRNAALAEGGAAQAPIFGHPTALPAAQAALVLGATSHALDYDDTHFDHIGHTSVAVVSAAVAMAAKLGATWADFHAAALQGSEVAIRVGTWLGRAHYQAGFHQTATAGAFGATAACARLMGLTPDQTAHALGLATTRAAGLKAQFGTMGKPYNAGIAAQTGVICAVLAAQGFVSNPSALEDFADTHAAERATLPTEPRFHAISHKLHACCHGLHAGLEAMALLKGQGIQTAAAKQITVTTHPRWLKVCNQPSPATGLEAKFSYRQALALAALGHDTAALGTWSDALCRDADVLALRACVVVKTDETSADTAVVLDIDDTRAQFDLAAPLPFKARAARVRAKADSLIGTAASSQLQATITGHDLPAFLVALTQA